MLWRKAQECQAEAAKLDDSKDTGYWRFAGLAKGLKLGDQFQTGRSISCGRYRFYRRFSE